MKSILFACTLLVFGFNASSQGNNYPKSNLDISNNDDFSTFSLLDSEVEKYNVFFSGENHQYRWSNAKLELKLLKYLNKKANVNHLLLEFGYTSGYLVDRYVRFDDTLAYQILKTYFAESYMWLFKGVKDYNTTLDSLNKIKVHGIDFEDNMFFTVKTLVKIMPNKEAPNEIGLQIETIRNMESRYSKSGIGSFSSNLGSGIYGNYYQADNTMREVLENYDKNKDLYDSYFEKEAGTVSEIMEHVRYYLEWRDYITTGKMQERPYRERYMFNNFMTLTEKNQGEKFFGQFGRCHTSFNKTDTDCDINYYNSLVGKINSHDNTFLNKKVCVIAGIYPKIEFNTNKLKSYKILQSLKKEASDTSLTLFPITDDSLKYGDLYNHYKFIFINNNSSSSEYNLSIKQKDRNNKSGFWRRADNYDVFVGLSYGLHAYGLKTKSLNKFYSFYNLAEPSSPLIMQSISLNILDNLMGTFVTAGYNWLPEVISATSDTSTIGLSVSSFYMRGGHDLFDLTPLINFMPCFGISYNELKVRHTIDNLTQLFQTESIPAEITYKNPAILLDFSLHLSTQIYFIGLSIYGGYQVDLSSKKWRNSGSYSTLAPSTSLGGWYAGVNIGLFYFD